MIVTIMVMILLSYYLAGDHTINILDKISQIELSDYLS